MGLLAATNQDGGGEVLFLVLVLAIVGGIVGALIGNSKDRAGTGFLLGFLLGFIGWIIVAVMEPSPEERTRRQQEATTAAAMGAAIYNAQSGAAAHYPAAPPAAAATDHPCPWCAEMIKPAAIVCRFCGRDVEPATAPPPPVTPPTPRPLRPPPAPVSSPPAPPAASSGTGSRWLPDPLGLAPLRLWNGNRWTEKVRNHQGGHWTIDDARLAVLKPPTDR